MTTRRNRVNRPIRRMVSCTSGASAAEFALLLPVLMLLLFGTFQISLLMYSYSLMASAARDETRAMAVCSVTDIGKAATDVLPNLPAWVKATDWTVTPVIADPDVSMTISVDPAKAAVIAYLPFIAGPLTTHVTMRKEPLAFSSVPC